MLSTGSSCSPAVSDSASGAGVVVAGLVSYQDAATIGSVAAAVREGLAAHFPHIPMQMVLVDMGSTDGSAARAREALGAAGDLLEPAVVPSTADLLDVPYHGIPGKARALHAILTAARELGARACVVFDGGVSTLTPDRVATLVRPIIEREADYVSPFYLRLPFEGALTKGVVYPVVRAVYGVRLRQPAAAEFACTGQVVDHFLHEDLWERGGSQFGIDIWLATAAASADFRLAETALGVRTHGPRGEEVLDLGATIVQVVGALFTDLERRAGLWQRQRTRIPVQQIDAAPAAAPEHSPVDVERLVDAFRLGFRELRDVWTWVLPPRTIVELQKLLACPPAAFRVDDGLWARIVYDFAIGFRLRSLAREHLLRSFVPLYSGWLASYISQVREAGSGAADRRIEALAEAFQAQQSYLIARWRWPERLRTG
jgi:glucosylglycerate synthase